MAKKTGEGQKVRTKAPNRCSFCARTPKEAGSLVAGPKGQDVYICQDCSTEVDAVFRRDRTATLSLSKHMPTPRQIVSHLDRFIIGQEKAKRVLSVHICNHYKRLIDRGENNPFEDDADLAKVTIEKSNILLVGPTGSGKTLLAKSIADYLHVPFAIGDATTLTEAGYVGEDVENLLLKLLRAADFDMDAAQRGIIFIDEIDKLHKTGKNVSITRDVSGEGVQQALLKLIEGNVCNIPPQGGRKHPEQQYIQMDTTNILFICGGSFTGLNEIIDKRVGGGGIGFGSKPKDDKKRKAELLQQVTQDDLEHFGMIPELMGRLPVISVLKELSQEDLKRVLVEPENALLKQYRKLARYDAANLEFTDDAVTEIAKIAFEKGLGARALRTVVEDFMMEIQFDLPEQPSNKTYVVDADVVRGKKNIFLVKGEAA